MGENTINLDSGTLYISGPDGSYSEFGEIKDLKVYEVSLVDDAPDPNTYIYKPDDCLKGTVEAFARFSEELMLLITGVFDIIIDSCPNRRVAYLAKYAKKKRARKKNLHRAIKILEDIADEET